MPLEYKIEIICCAIASVFALGMCVYCAYKENEKKGNK